MQEASQTWVARVRSLSVALGGSRERGRRTVMRVRLQLLEPLPQAVDIVAAPAVELAAEADVQAAPADDVGHERVTGREPAAGERKRMSVRSLARPRRSGKSRSSIRARRRSSCRSRAPARSGSWSPRERSRKSSSSGRSGRAADSIRWASASGAETVLRATAALTAGSSSRKAGFRFTMPLR